jgi:hypothetical protein
VSYYKTPPGKQDEWLALYLKWHRPIMDYQIQQGVTTSSTVYAMPGTRSPAVGLHDHQHLAPASKARKLNITRGQVIQKLFPDLDAYTAGETALGARNRTGIRRLWNWTSPRHPGV